MNNQHLYNVNYLSCPSAHWASPQTQKVDWMGIIIFPYHRLENWGSGKKNKFSKLAHLERLSSWPDFLELVTAVLPPGCDSTVSTLRGMTLLHCVSRKEKPGQPGEDIRAVKQWVNGISISRWSLDNWVAHLAGRWRELGWEENNWQHVAFDL